MKIRLFLPIIFVSIMLVGCGSSYNSADASSSYDGSMKSVGTTNDYNVAATEELAYDDLEETPAEGNFDSQSGIDDYNKYEKKIVYTYNITVQTQEFDTLKDALYERVQQFGGFVESSYLDSYDSRVLSMTVRLPQEKATEFLDFIGESGNVTSQSESATDRTLEYVDIDSRLNSYNEELKTLEGLSKQAETVTELLEIENTIAEVRGNRDSLQSQLNNIDDKVNYSTIYLDLREVVEYTYSQPTFLEKIASGWSMSMSRIADMISDFIVAIPVFLVGLILFAIPAAIILFVAIKIIIFVKRLATKKKGKVDKAIETDIKETTSEP